MRNGTSARTGGGKGGVEEKADDGYCPLLLLRSPLEMDSFIFPHLRSTFVASDVTVSQRL